MPERPIIFDNTPFLGRTEEQKQYRNALRDLLRPDPTEDLPYIFLLYGDGGMGKTALAKCFRRIAEIEQPFESAVEILWIDWEDERSHLPTLQVGRENIGPETVFGVIHSAAERQKWGRHFGLYQKTVNLRNEAEKKAIEVASSHDPKDEFAPLRGASATALAKFIRAGIPAIGESGEHLVQESLNTVIKVGAEEATKLRGALQNRLQSKLKPEQYDIFLNPMEQLARAIADGLKKASSSKPLVVFLDTYEIVDRTDPYVRMIMRAAGSRILWVISGRDDLVRGHRSDSGYLKGYADDFARRLYPFDMRQLAIEDIRAYFQLRAPQRPLTEAEAGIISRTTHGIPLAVREAADIWMAGASINSIAGDTNDRTPRDQIVYKMTERYLAHVVTKEDRNLIYAIALARGNTAILRAMLLGPDGDGNFDLDALLHRLERDYAFINAERARLHDAPTRFFLEYLRTDIRRTSPAVKTLYERAVAELRAQISKFEGNLPTIEDRYDDEDWTKSVLEFTYYLFWLDEFDAWRWFVPRFVESITYSRAVRRGLLQIGNSWKTHMSKTGQKRLKVLSEASVSDSGLGDSLEMFSELEKLDQKGWIGGEGEQERHAILGLEHGQLLMRFDRPVDALIYYRRAEHDLPRYDGILRRRLGEDLSFLGLRLVETGKEKEALEIAQNAVQVDPKNADAYHRLGHVYARFEHNAQSIAAFQSAIEIDSLDAGHFSCLGHAYCDAGRYEDAADSFQRAIKLEPENAYAYNGLGKVRAIQGRDEESIAEFAHASKLATDTEDRVSFTNNLGNEYFRLQRYEDAITTYKRSIEIDPNRAESFHSRGHVYRDLDREQEAIDALQSAIRLQPQDEELHLCIGELYFRFDHNNLAIAAYRHVISLAPKSGAPHFGLGNVYHDLGRTEEAIAEYQRAIGLDPKDAHVHNNLGNVYRDLGRTEEAIAEYQRAIELDPKDAHVHNNLGNGYLDLGRTEEAIAEYQRVIEFDPKDADAHHNLGNGYLGLGRTDGAIAEYRRAIELNPKDAAPHHGLGNVYRTIGRIDEALAEYQRAIELDPKNALLRTSLAVCLREIDRKAEAAEHLKIARELIGKENEYARACFEAICSNVDEALIFLKVALEKKQTTLAWVRRDPDFESLRSDPRCIALVGEDA